MYRMLQRNRQEYFKVYESQDTEYGYERSKVLQELMSKELYDRWKIGEMIPKCPRFETLKWDLWGVDYESIRDDRFINDKLLGQIKLIKLCLGAAYLESI